MAYGAESDTEDAAMAIFGMVDVPFCWRPLQEASSAMAMQTAATTSRGRPKKRCAQHVTANRTQPKTPGQTPPQQKPPQTIAPVGRNRRQMPHYRQSLSKSLENKVLVLVRRYADDLAVSEEQENVRLSVSKLYQYVVADGSVPRQKKAGLEKMIERAIDVLREEGEDEDEEAEIDSDFEGLNEQGLMDPKVRRSISRCILQLEKQFANPATSRTRTR